jgi:hypothetical protein
MSIPAWDICVRDHIEVPSLCLLHSGSQLCSLNTAFISGVTELICMENWFLDGSLEMDMQLLRDGL